MKKISYQLKTLLFDGEGLSEESLEFLKPFSGDSPEIYHSVNEESSEMRGSCCCTL